MALRRCMWHCSLAGVKPDDEVLVSTLTFIAPANAIRYAGAWPVFIDAEPDYWQMDPQRVADFLEKECRLENGELRNRTTGRRVKAIIPVHILGHPVNMKPILELARKFNLIVIEDATESLGAKYEDHPDGLTRRHRLLQLQRQQDHHHRRRRNDYDEQRSLGAQGQVSHHPGQRRSR